MLYDSKARFLFLRLVCLLQLSNVALHVITVELIPEQVRLFLLRQIQVFQMALD